MMAAVSLSMSLFGYTGNFRRFPIYSKYRQQLCEAKTVQELNWNRQMCESHFAALADKGEGNMNLLTLFTLAVGLSMDAFAVAVCKGLAMRKLTVKNAVIVGAWFGGFQALMPAIGYILGVQFKDKITAIDHWIAFVLLGLIGLKMIKEALGNEEEEANASLAVKEMLVLAVATSIDALAVGITFAFLSVNITAAVSFIGVITFLLSAVGVKVGNVFGTKYKAKAELAGGVILILLGVKILLEHTGIL